MLSRLENGKKVVGLKQTRKAVVGGKAQAVFLAADADPVLTGPIETLCRERQVPLTDSLSMKELGGLCGISVGAAAAALLKD